MAGWDDRAEITTIEQFWFADIGDGFDVRQQQRRWYRGGVALDRRIERQFGELLAAAKQQQLAHWSQSPVGALALVVLLDQFSRHIFRYQAEAFAADELARNTLQQALQQGLDSSLGWVQRSFLYSPLQHAESLPDQQRSVQLAERLLAEAPAAGKHWLNSNLEALTAHRDIIARFGRFPHRNRVLGRVSTTAEISWLQRGGSRFGQ